MTWVDDIEVYVGNFVPRLSTLNRGTVTGPWTEGHRHDISDLELRHSHSWTLYNESVNK